LGKAEGRASDFDDPEITITEESTDSIPPEIFDRPTAVPLVPLEQLAHEMMDRPTPVGDPGSQVPTVPRGGVRELPELTLDLSSQPPPDSLDSGRQAWLPSPGQALGMPSTPVPIAKDRARTAPEPVVRRQAERAERALDTKRSSSDPADPEHKEDLAFDLPEDFAASALDLIEQSAGPRDCISDLPPPSVPPAREATERNTVTDMKDRYAVGDFTGALVVAESMLETDPHNEDAKRYAQSCREILTQMYAARLGPTDQVVSVTVPPEQITWLSLDHRAGFLLSLVDGISTVEEILDISGMPRLDALRILYTLVQQNVVTLE
jgi:hypothetical protein